MAPAKRTTHARLVPSVYQAVKTVLTAIGLLLNIEGVFCQIPATPLPHPFSLASLARPHPKGCPAHTVYVESSYWWQTDSNSYPNATNYGRFKVQACWPHLTVVRDQRVYQLVTSFEPSSPPVGQMEEEQYQVAYQTGSWLDPCSLNNTKTPGRTFSACAATGGTVIDAMTDPWDVVGQAFQQAASASFTSGWEPTSVLDTAPPTSSPLPFQNQQCPAAYASSIPSTTSSRKMLLEDFPSEAANVTRGPAVNANDLQIYAPVILPDFKAGSVQATRQLLQTSPSCTVGTPNCPQCNPVIITQANITSATQELVAPVMPRQPRCAYTDTMVYNTAQFPVTGVPQNAGLKMLSRLLFPNYKEVVASPAVVRKFEMNIGFGMVQWKSAGAVDVLSLQRFDYNNQDGNELSIRGYGYGKGNTFGYVRPAWMVPIMGDVHFFIRIYDCKTDFPGTPMEEWSISLNPVPESGVAGQVLLTGTTTFTGVVHLDANALKLLTGWQSLAIIIRARDPATNAVITTIHQHWFQTLRKFPKAQNVDFIVYAQQWVRRISNQTVANVAVADGAAPVGFYTRVPYQQSIRTVMHWQFDRMKPRRCPFQQVTLYIFLKYISILNNGTRTGNNRTMPIQVYGSEDPNYLQYGTTYKDWGSSLQNTTLLGRKSLGLVSDVYEWHAIKLKTGWMNRALAKNKVLWLIISTPDTSDQIFYFATVLDSDFGQPGAGYMPFIRFVPSC